LRKEKEFIRTMRRKTSPGRGKGGGKRMMRVVNPTIQKKEVEKGGGKKERRENFVERKGGESVRTVRKNSSALGGGECKEHIKETHGGIKNKGRKKVNQCCREEGGKKKDSPKKKQPMLSRKKKRRKAKKKGGSRLLLKGKGEKRTSLLETRRKTIQLNRGGGKNKKKI